jgi:hypothetical protein
VGAVAPLGGGESAYTCAHSVTDNQAVESGHEQLLLLFSTPRWTVIIKQFPITEAVKKSRAFNKSGSSPRSHKPVIRSYPPKAKF